MARVSTIKFNGSNAYELAANEHATSWPQGVQGEWQVSVGVELYTAATGAGATLRIRAINAGGTLVGEYNQPFAIHVRNVWQRAEHTFELPSNTDKVELRIIATGGTILFAQPKLVTGNEPGAYNINHAPQLTMLTATGIYTGTVSAQQVILTDGGGLNERMTTINDSMIQLEDTVAGKTSRLTASGLYTSQINAGQITAGTIRSSKGLSWLNLDDGTFSFAEGAFSWDGASLNLTGRFASRYSNDKPTRVEIDNGQIRMVNDLGTIVGLINNNNASVLEGLNITTGLNSKYMSFGHLVGNGLVIDYYINHGENPSGWTEKHIFIGDARVVGELNVAGVVSAPVLKSNVIHDSLGNERVTVGASGDFYIRNRAGQAALWVSEAGKFAQLLVPSNRDHAIGVDETGAYKITSGVKTYL